MGNFRTLRTVQTFSHQHLIYDDFLLSCGGYCIYLRGFMYEQYSRLFAVVVV